MRYFGGKSWVIDAFCAFYQSVHQACSLEYTDPRAVLVLMAQKLLLCHSYSFFVVSIRGMKGEWRRRRGEGTRGVFGVVHNAPLWVGMAGWWCHGWQDPKPTELVKAWHDWTHRRVSDIVVLNQAVTEGSSPFNSNKNTSCQSVSAQSISSYQQRKGCFPRLSFACLCAYSLSETPLWPLRVLQQLLEGIYV